MTGILKIKPVLRAVLCTTVVAVAFLVPAQALAQSNDCSQTRSDPSAAQYCPQSDVLAVSDGGSSGPASPAPTVAAAAVTTTASSSSSLPFTGLDVGVLAVAAAILLGTGLALRRFTVSPSSKE